MIWWLEGSGRLGREAERHITTAGAELYFSAASWWEMSIKRALGRLNVDLQAFQQIVAANGIQFLDVRFVHAEAVVGLPPHHGDPFDRMLVAQAQVEGLRLLTRDARLKVYGQAVLCT